MNNKHVLLAISGQICRENSACLKNFWSGFVNIQNAVTVESSIVAHSWNPEYDELVSKVYSPVAYLSEKQPSFVTEYMPCINPVDRFEKGLKRFQSTWKNCSPQALLGNARSRSRAIKLIDSIESEGFDQLIAARWDQGLTGSRSVNQIIYDSALPKEHIYISYYSEIDEGYADMWFVAPLNHARKFAEYDSFLLDCLSGNNDYFERFTETGWHVAMPRSEWKRSLYRWSVLFLRKSRLDALLSLVGKTGAWGKAKAAAVSRRLDRFRNLPEQSGENACILEHKSVGRTWPAYQALNNHAILKYFYYQQSLRESTRFLDVDDFEQKPGVGRMINPVSFAYVIYSHSSFSDCWEMCISQAKKHLPDNCVEIILVADDTSDTDERFDAFKTAGVSLETYDDQLQYTDRLRQVFDRLSKRHQYLYFVHEDMPLIGQVDAVYLNSLLHYFGHSNENYIKLVDTDYVDQKVDHPSFPGLVKNTGGYAISVQPCLIKPEVYSHFLTNFNCNIYDFENLCLNSNFQASAVKGGAKVGKYLQINTLFPQICTAISKGKWCVDEWPAEIKYLAEEYKIDLDIRGRVND